MNIFKKALIVALSVGLISVPTVTKEVEAADTKRIYLNAGGSSLWDQANAWFALYSWNTSNTWNKMEEIGNTGIFKADIPTSHTSCIFLRKDPSKTGLDWDGEWNRKGNLPLPTNPKNCYVVTGWGNTDGSWNQYNEYSITYHFNDGITEDKVVPNAIGHAVSTSVTFEQASQDGYNFLGWSTVENGDVEYSNTYTFTDRTSNLELYAVWEKIEEDKINLTYEVGEDSKHSVQVLPGSKIEDNIPTELIKKDNYTVLSWDKSGVVSEDTTIKATKYYYSIDEVKSELSFSYGYKTGVVIFQCPISYDDGVPTVTAKNKTTQQSKVYDMTWCNDAANNKKEWYANIDPIYNELTFKWKNNGTECTYTCDRDYTNNAIWWDSETENGKFEYDNSNETVNNNIEKFISSVSNMNLRIGTLLLKANAFGGVSSYGIRIAKGDTIADDNYYGPKWTSNEIKKFDAEGKESQTGEYIRWNAVINNIPHDNYQDGFTAIAYVEIDGKCYDLCEARTISVLTAAQSYTSILESGSIENKACQFIVDTYGA